MSRFYFFANLGTQYAAQGISIKKMLSDMADDSATDRRRAAKAYNQQILRG